MFWLRVRAISLCHEATRVAAAAVILICRDLVRQMGHMLVEHVHEAMLTHDLQPSQEKEFLDQAGTAGTLCPLQGTAF
jgi:hypothetical protein